MKFIYNYNYCRLHWKLQRKLVIDSKSRTRSCIVITLRAARRLNMYYTCIKLSELLMLVRCSDRFSLCKSFRRIDYNVKSGNARYIRSSETRSRAVLSWININRCKTAQQELMLLLCWCLTGILTWSSCCCCDSFRPFCGHLGASAVVVVPRICQNKNYKNPFFYYAK